MLGALGEKGYFINLISNYKLVKTQLISFLLVIFFGCESASNFYSRANDKFMQGQ